MSENSRAIARWAWLLALVAGGGVLLLAWDRFGFGGNSSLEGGQALVDQAFGGSSPWSFTDQADPMTDEQILAAQGQMVADGFLVDATIACRPASGVVTYTFVAFADDGETGAEFRADLVGTNQIVQRHHAVFRADAGVARTLSNSEPRFSNMFELDAAPYLGLASARLVTVKLLLSQGEPVLQIDQSEPVPARALKPCNETREAIAEGQRAKEALPPQPRIRTFTISDGLLEMSGRDSGNGTGVEDVWVLCTGDRIVVKNQATIAVALEGATLESDDFSRLGTPQPGTEIGLPAREAGQFVIVSPDFPNLRYRYDVRECR